MEYLHWIIKHGKLKVANRTAEAIRALQVPATVTELRSILRFCNIVKRFLNSFARIASELSEEHRISQSEDHRPPTKEYLEALETLKKKPISMPVLTGPGCTGQYILDTKASDTYLSYVLLQKQDSSTKRDIRYFHEIFKGRKKNLDTTCCCFLAVVGAVLVLRPC